MTSVLDRIAGLARAGKISPAMADEAAAVYRARLAAGDTEAAAALKMAEALRAKAKARLSAVQFCVNNSDRIEDVKAAMREQWREAHEGRKPN